MINSLQNNSCAINFVALGEFQNFNINAERDKLTIKFKLRSKLDFFIHNVS